MCPPCVCPDPPPVSGGDVGIVGSSVVSSAIIEVYLARVIVGGSSLVSWWEMPTITLTADMPYAGQRIDTGDVVWGGLLWPAGVYTDGTLALPSCPAALGAGWDNVQALLFPDTSMVELSGGMTVVPSMCAQLF